MTSRRYPTAELYEERQRDFYRNGNRGERTYDELDVEISRDDPRRSAPDFLREDWGRTSAGPLVVRDRVTEEIKSPRRREVEEDTLVVRGGRRESREVGREDISIRREKSRHRPREVKRDETDIVIKHRDSSRPRPREGHEVDREEIRFRRGEVERPRPREVDREEITFRRGEREPPRTREVDREEVIYRRDERGGREREFERDTVVVRPRERSLPPPRELVAREKEEFVVRRREPPPREEVKDEIIIRRTEQRSPSPPPEPEPIVRPPIIQEVITHHRHIDHGKFYRGMY